MLTFLSDYLPTVIGAAVVFALVALLTVHLMRKRRKQKETGCGGCCGCPNAGMCHPK